MYICMRQRSGGEGENVKKRLKSPTRLAFKERILVDLYSRVRVNAK